MSVASMKNDEAVKDGLALLKELKLASHEHLINMPRQTCPICLKKRKYFCYSCLEVLGEKEKVPHVDLPIKLDVIIYPTEKESKSTALHASLICGKEQVDTRTFPDVPKYNTETDVILFPGPDAKLLDEMNEKEFKSIRKIIVLDSQWSNVSKMERHENLKGLRRVKIRMYSTTFWRHQTVGSHCLATIEAIYYFFREYGSKNGDYDGRYDNLLYYYWFLYSLIQHTYQQTKRPYASRHVEGYINEDVPLDVVKQVTVPNTTSTSASSSSTTQTKRAKLDDEKTVVNEK